MNKLAFSAVLALYIWGALAFAQPANIYTFSGDVDLEVDYTLFQSSGGHYIGAKGDTVYVVTSDGGNVYCQKSTDGGQSFGLPVLVNTAADADNPSMRVDTTGVLYVAYQLNADIYFSKSTDGGISFTPSIKVNDDTIPQVGQEKPAIAVNNKGQVFIVWFDKRTNPFSTFFSASYDGGETFTPNVQVNELGTQGTYADVAAGDNGRVYVTYRGDIVARSVDSGLSFTHRTIIVDSSRGFSSIAVSGTLVGLFGEAVRIVGDSLETTLRFIVSTDYAETFRPSVRIDEDTTGDFKATALTTSLSYQNNTFFLTWREHIGLTDRVDIFFSYSTDTGRTFVANKKVNSDVVRNHVYPSIAVNGMGKAFVAWRDPRRDPFFGLNWHTFAAIGNPTYLKGDLNLDLVLSIADVVTQINAVFSGLPFPAPFESADGNCDGTLSPVDVVLELKAVFMDEPFPC